MRVLRYPQVKDRVGYSRMHLYRLERDGLFPKRVQLGPHSVGWLESEIDAWIVSKAGSRCGAAGPASEGEC